MKSLNPYHSGKQILIDDCQRVSISACLREAKEKLKKVLAESTLELGSQTIELVASKTAFDGARYWFKCPHCGRRAGTLFVHPLTNAIGCRKCLGLEYRSRRYKGMMEAGFQKYIK
jgi:hypothetical protein